MENRLADLHIHSYYSDGTMSPKEILDIAYSKGVSLLAITDHDLVEGSLELLELCKGYDIRCIPGVELDSLDNGKDIHILGYGIDFKNKAFMEFVHNNRCYLNAINTNLIDKMQADYKEITMEDYLEFPHDRRKGGWKALQYLMQKGLTKSAREAFKFYEKYDCQYSSVGFPSVGEAIRQIHSAGGKAVLAHPGVTLKGLAVEEFQTEFLRLIAYGVDGVECYYPTHTSEITGICLKVCKERHLLITSGSDCHGTFGGAEIGGLGIKMEQLKLGDLILKGENKC